MRITEIGIRGFRSIRNLSLRLEKTTVLIGENNSGKTAILDALRLALTRSYSRRSGLSDFDFHLEDEKSDPRKGEIEITIRISEEGPGEWPVEIAQKLDKIVQTDVNADLEFIWFRVKIRFDPAERDFKQETSFLNVAGQPLKVNAEASLASLARYVPVFYLSALRDVADEFSPRSQFWARLLRSLEVPDAAQASIETALEKANSEVSAADPRLKAITETISKIGGVFGGAPAGAVGIRALPLKAWELLSRAQIVFRGKGAPRHFPLSRHGQGVQSLSVLFLFEAFVTTLLELEFEKQSAPILALEEPEAHLHPHAIRALWDRVSGLPGQKLLATHSPYFLQHVPLRNVRVLRRSKDGVTVFWLPRDFSEAVPPTKELDDLVAAKPDLYRYDKTSLTLVALRKIEEGDWRKLAVAVGKQGVAAAAALREKANRYLSDAELAKVEGYVRRGRGEILFARCWLLCEGQGDAAMLSRFSAMCEIDLDVLGISVIDYQAGGSPGAFTALALALGIPWYLICDDDTGGTANEKEVLARGYVNNEVPLRLRKLPVPDIEALVASAFLAEVTTVATELGFVGTNAAGPAVLVDKELVPFLRTKKGDWPIALSKLLEGQPGTRVPPFFVSLLDDCRKAAE